MINSSPENVNTECLTISRWDVVVVKSKSREVVLSIVEDVIRLILRFACLVDIVHENYVFFSVGARHYFHKCPDI